VRYACSPSGCVTACVVHTADSIRRFDSNEKNDSQVPSFTVHVFEIEKFAYDSAFPPIDCVCRRNFVTVLNRRYHF